MIDLDSPVNRYLRRWHIPESDFDVNQVTVRRLLIHTSGLSVLPASESFTYPPSLEETLSRSYGTFGGLRLVRRPGSEFQYNNGNHVLLQLLIEEVVRTDFISFIHRTVLEPLEMKQSTYAPESEQVATPYDESGNAVPQYQNQNFAASRGLYSTAGNLARFVAPRCERPTVPYPVEATSNLSQSEESPHQLKKAAPITVWDTRSSPSPMT